MLPGSSRLTCCDPPVDVGPCSTTAPHGIALRFFILHVFGFAQSTVRLMDHPQKPELEQVKSFPELALPPQQLHSPMLTQIECYGRCCSVYIAHASSRHTVIFAPPPPRWATEPTLTLQQRLVLPRRCFRNTSLSFCQCIYCPPPVPVAMCGEVRTEAVSLPFVF